MAGSQPPTLPPGHIPSLAFNQCTLTPEGVSVMVDHLRSQPLLRDLPVARVRAAAIALIAFGGSSDGHNQVHKDGLHDAYFAAHAANMPTNWRDGLCDDYMRLLMDLLTWQDRVSGGASVLMSTQATRRPDSLPSLTEVKIDVFLPVLLREQPRMDIVLSRMVQRFAEEIGLPAMQRFAQAKSFARKGHVTATVVPHFDTQPLIPPSEATWYTFYGREPGALEDLISSQIAVVGAAPQPTTPRPLPVPPPSNVSPKTDDTRWTVEDVKHYLGRLKACSQGDEAALRTVVGEVSMRLPDILAIILDLDCCIKDLELIKTTQTSGVEDLRDAFEGSMDERHRELMLVKEELTASFASVSSASSSMFGTPGKGKPPVTRSRASTVASSWVTESPPASFYGARSAERSTAPRPSFPLPPVPPPSLTSSRSSSTYSSTSDYVLPDARQGAHRPWKTYGPSTEKILTREGWPRRTHRVLHDVEEHYSVERWPAALRSKIPFCTEFLAQDLAEAMRFDCDMSS